MAKITSNQIKILITILPILKNKEIFIVTYKIIHKLTNNNYCSSSNSNNSSNNTKTINSNRTVLIIINQVKILTVMVLIVIFNLKHQVRELIKIILKRFLMFTKEIK